MSELLYDSGLLGAAALVMALSAAALIVRALFADRARGRRRCPRCWYDMSGSPGLVCSECGHDAGRETRLFRTRRRWRRAALTAIIAAALIVAIFAPKVSRDGFHQAMPLTVLLLMVEASGDDSDRAFTEIVSRPRTEWQWQRKWLLEIAIDAMREPRRYRAFGKGFEGLITASLGSGELGRFDLIDDLASARPVTVDFSVEPVTPDRLVLQAWARSTFDHIKYRFRAEPDAEWLPDVVEVLAADSMLATRDVRGGPSGTHTVTFRVFVEFAPLGIYGSYGPEEYGRYDSFEITQQIAVPR